MSEDPVLMWGPSVMLFVAGFGLAAAVFRTNRPINQRVGGGLISIAAAAFAIPEIGRMSFAGQRTALSIGVVLAFAAAAAIYWPQKRASG